MYTVIINVFVFLFGLCIGSFLNCVICRLALPNFSFWKNLGGLNRSYCPKCKEQILWHDLIPVFSFLFLRGKCRYCKKSISIQYSLVELITGLVFLLIFNHSAERFALASGFSNYSQITASVLNLANILFLFLSSSVLIIIFVYDLKYYLIPDKVLFPAIAIALFYRVIENFSLLGNYFFAALIASVFFLAIFLISGGRWMGFGDVKLAVLMGFLLGLPNVLAALFLAFFFGAIISIILIIFGKKGLKSEIPFGPFLIAGTFLAMFWGEEIIQWYLHLFLI